MTYPARFLEDLNMNSHRFLRSIALFTTLSLAVPFTIHAQTDLGTVDFGYVPVGTTNLFSGYVWFGGEANGTQLVMTSEGIIGSNATDFSTSPNYAGATLNYGQEYPYSLSFSPHSASFETAALTNSETPSPPFGTAIIHLQGIGIPANRPATGPIVPELAPLQQSMTNYLVTHQFEAGTLALMHDSKLVLRQGYGWRDTNFTKVIHPDNLFRLASVSKMLTAAAIYKLIDAHKISATTTIYSYLGIQPWGGTLGDSRIPNITVQNLLDHAGGWDRDTSPVGDPVFSTVEISSQMGLNYPAAPTNVISWMFSKPLDFAPGSTNVYSNFGFQILGRVIEKASGKPYIQYIQQDLLGAAGISNSLGFNNVIQSRSRPRDLSPWEIWYADLPDLYQSAVDYPTNLQVRFADGGGYYESYDSFGGVSASAIGLCNYLLNYWEGGEQRISGEYYGWNYTFYGSLPGATSILYQNINEDPTTTNGLEFAALFNQRDSDPNDNEEASDAIINAAGTITSWPTNGGGKIQWGIAATNVNRTAGLVTIPLIRSGAATLPVKISYTTYSLSADNSNYTPTSGIISFAANELTKNVTVPILNDGLIDPPRTFSLELISASGGAWLGSQLSSVVTILDTDVPLKFIGPYTLLANGSFQGTVQSSAGLVLTVQVSTNLANWQPLQTITNTTGTFQITDATAATRPQSFYRLVVP